MNSSTPSSRAELADARRAARGWRPRRRRPAAAAGRARSIARARLAHAADRSPPPGSSRTGPRAPAPSGTPCCCHVVSTAVFMPDEAEVEPAPAHRPRQRKRVRIARLRQFVDDRPRRVAEAEHLADLVERLAGGVVAGGAEQLVDAVVARDHQLRVAAGDEQRQVREAGRRVAPSSHTADRWPSRWLTPTSGRPRAQAIALAACTPTSSAPTSPGPRVTAMPSTSSSARAGAVERRLQHRDQVGHVVTRRDLGHHAAALGVHLHLRRHHVAAHAHAVLDERRRRLVARRLEPEDEHYCASLSASPGSSGCRRRTGPSARASDTSRRRCALRGCATSAARRRRSRGSASALSGLAAAASCAAASAFSRLPRSRRQLASSTSASSPSALSGDRLLERHHGLLRLTLVVERLALGEERLVRVASHRRRLRRGDRRRRSRSSPRLHLASRSASASVGGFVGAFVDGDATRRRSDWTRGGLVAVGSVADATADGRSARAPPPSAAGLAFATAGLAGAGLLPPPVTPSADHDARDRRDRQRRGEDHEPRRDGSSGS